MTDLIRLSAAALADKLAAGEVSSVEATQAHLDRIADVDGDVHAFLHVSEHALEVAGEIDRRRAAGEVLGALAEMDMERLLDPKAVADILHLPEGPADLDTHLQPRGYRMLARIPRLPDSVVESVVNRFGNLQKIMRATIDDLEEVEGVGETRARSIKDGLARLAESSILDRYS